MIRVRVWSGHKTTRRFAPEKLYKNEFGKEEVNEVGEEKKENICKYTMFEKGYSLKLGKIAVVPLAGTWIEI